MTAHELAKKLLEGPDLPVIINGWGSDEGIAHEVDIPDNPSPAVYMSSRDSIATPRDSLGYPKPRRSIALIYEVV